MARAMARVRSQNQTRAIPKAAAARRRPRKRLGQILLPARPT